MRSPADWRLRAVAIAALLVVTIPSRAADRSDESAQPESETIGQAEIARALAIVKVDPNLATDRTVRTLRWKDPAAKPPSGTPAWVRWIAGLFGWLGQSARVLMWCAAVIMAGVLAVFIVRLVRRRDLALPEGAFIAPTHVRDLDIRPETLPPDIGAAARELWDRGEHRASLALLYRGLLSRLAHVHRIPIRDSSTEGDCLVLASHLGPRICEYVSHVVGVWQRAVYGREQIQASTVYLLFDEFAPAIGSSSSLERTPAAGA